MELPEKSCGCPGVGMSYAGGGTELFERSGRVVRAPRRLVSWPTVGGATLERVLA